MNVNQYLDAVNKLYQSGISSEHAYRPDFRDLVNELVSDITITNEPSNVTDCGNPDYVITKGKIPIGFIEAKDVGKDLNSKQYKEQFGRYRKALDNLIITDYIWFQFFQHGELTHEIRIAEVSGKKIQPLAGNHDDFINLIKDFCSYVSQTIKSPKKLAELMAAKARLLENILEKAITTDEESDDNSALQQQYKTFKDILIHDLTPQGFADIYSQTLAYGMFAARLHDDTLDDFSRQEAAELIPKSNPFLRKLFSHVAGIDIDERIKTTVDNLADVFRATNVEELLKNFGKSTLTHDPIIHFYETFLAEYDPKLRKARGVWYTPEPVVSFIVRSVDEILKSEFDLKDGLADISKTNIKVKTDKPDRRTKSGYVEIDKQVHKVQILDPATGTGTFLAEVVKFIHNEKFSSMKGMWSNYVEEDLIPRLNGFELLMASYSMAHLKLDMLLNETGYKSKKNKRFNVFLTNSLEEHHPDTGTLFSSWLSSEANEADHIKRDTPVMVVIGNPPYSVSSSNKGNWIEELMNDYKKDLNEKNVSPLSDDYIKFIRYGQHYIEKNGEGVLAFITNNSFIDGVIHKRMRKSLCNTFDKIHIVDLHGNSKKSEVTADGKKDENVFDIMQGVSINVFIKSKSTINDNAKIYLSDLQGTRESKYKILNEKTIYSIDSKAIPCKEPNYLFIDKDYKLMDDFQKGISPVELFVNYSSGVQTEFDIVAIQMNKRDSEETYNKIINNDVSTLLNKFNLTEKFSGKIKKAKDDLLANPYKIFPLSYRPFENRSIIYTGKSNGLMGRPRESIMKHFFEGGNTALILKRARLLGKEKSFNHCFISNKIMDKNFLSDQSYCFPLYLYPDSSINQESLPSDLTRYHNLNTDILEKISNELDLSFAEEKIDSNETFTPIDLLDYMYAILHSPTYRKKYQEFLKMDFPRIPYPKVKDVFWSLVHLGRELRKVHLLESNLTQDKFANYPIDGVNVITRKINKNDWEVYDTNNKFGRIWINETQYFDKVPEIAWELHIGGYQPAQKWLKNRNQLSYEDILDYQKIISSLTETDRIMKEIDNIDFE